MIQPDKPQYTLNSDRIEYSGLTYTDSDNLIIQSMLTQLDESRLDIINIMMSKIDWNRRLPNSIMVDYN